MKKKKRLLIIGAVPHKNIPTSFNGQTVLMQEFVDFCDEHHYVYSHIDTFRFSNKLLNLLYFGVRFVFEICRCPVVMYNVSINGFLTMFYYTAPICYALGRKVAFRKYGGILQLNECSPRKLKRVIDLLNRAHVVLLETKGLIAEVSKWLKMDNVMWFPNSRKPAAVPRYAEQFGKRFVFISRMTEWKGVDLIKEAAEQLPEGYVVDLYGGIQDDKYKDPHHFEGSRAQYKGALRTDEVIPTLAQYDVMLLPTHWFAEGYPGAIIEAMSLGIPMITTRQGGIPEMITHQENGLLIPQHDAKALAEAMLSIDDATFQHLSTEALARFDRDFNANIINEKVYQRLMSH